MSLFVTGAGSFIGRELLRQWGGSVSGLDMAETGLPGVAQADIRAPDVADLIPQGCQALVHLAALSRDGDCCNRAPACFDINVMGTLNMLDAARSRGVRQFIFASTEWVYTNFDETEKTEDSPIDIGALTSEYALSKLVSEANLRQAQAQGDMDITVLRFGIVYGPRRDNWSAVESLLNAVATQHEVSVNALDTARRFIHVGDVAGAVSKAVGLPGFEIVNIQGAELVSLGRVIEASKKLLDTNPTIIENNPEAPSIRRVSGHKAQRLLNWSAGISLEDGLTSVINHLGLKQ